MSPTLVGKGFKYAQIRGEGNTSVIAQLSDFTINGTNFGNFASTGSQTVFAQLYTDNSGLFGDITATGTFKFTGSGGSEIPRIWLSLGDARTPAAVPEPGSLAALCGLGAMGLVAAWRRRKRTA